MTSLRYFLGGVGRNKGVGNESSLTLPFLIPARFLSLASYDGGLSRYRSVAASFGGSVLNRSIRTVLSPLPSIFKEESGFFLIRALSAPSRVDGNPSAGIIVHDVVGKKYPICQQHF